jgi:hypothetical protein
MNVYMNAGAASREEWLAIVAEIAKEHNGRIVMWSPRPRKVGEIVCAANLPEQPGRIVAEATRHDWEVQRQQGRDRGLTLDRNNDMLGGYFFWVESD